MQDCRHYFQLQCRFLLGNKGYGGHLGLCHIVWGKKHIKVRSKAGIYCTVKESCFLLFIFIFSWILTHLTFFSIFFRKWFRFRVNIESQEINFWLFVLYEARWRVQWSLLKWTLIWLLGMPLYIRMTYFPLYWKVGGNSSRKLGMHLLTPFISAGAVLRIIDCIMVHTNNNALYRHLN